MPLVNKVTARLFTLIVLGLLLHPWQLNANTPNILVSIKPLHSLVSALMLDIHTPELLLNSQQSPHSYSMKPSDRRRINRADIIIYASADIESFIPSIQRSLSRQKVIAITDIPGIKLLPARTFGAHSHSHSHYIDGHTWLSIDNAIIISQYLSNIFIQLDADNTQKYTLNRDRLVVKLRQLKIQIQHKMQPFSERPFLMFHDALQYFENDFKLTAGLFVTTSPEHKAGIRHISALKRKIQQQNIRCIFYEPPHIPRIIRAITAGRQVQLIALEPLGRKYTPGAEQYFNLLNGISDKLYNCMQQD
jgi:zinc transport system substrate-binding protein